MRRLKGVEATQGVLFVPLNPLGSPNTKGTACAVRFGRLKRKMLLLFTPLLVLLFFFETFCKNNGV